MKHALQSVAMLAVLLAPFLGGASPDLIATNATAVLDLNT